MLQLLRKNCCTKVEDDELLLLLRNCSTIPMETFVLNISVKWIYVSMRTLDFGAHKEKNKRRATLTLTFSEDVLDCSARRNDKGDETLG